MPANPVASTLTAAAAPRTAVYPTARNFIAGRFVAGGPPLLDVLNPRNGSLLSRVPLSSGPEVDAAVRAAATAFPAWSATPIKERV
jgi:malonate-semialdehyde dehydrogenase (acetylating)/methylmalonate-semialdehyde dehydrogenase